MRPAQADPPAWLEVKNFLYQLQNLDPDEASKTGFQLVVSDYSRDGSDAGAYTAAEIAAMRNATPQPKRLLCYLSIGEAENYRFYWQPDWHPGSPAWLDRRNPDWPGNFKVRYWDPEWQAIIFGYLDKIVAAGFDGVYLDILDAYNYYAEHGDTAEERDLAEQRMVDWVKAIAHYTRVTKEKSDFGVFPQNSAELGAHADYLAVCTGIGHEDLYFFGRRKTGPNWRASEEAALDVFRDAGKLVLMIDYPRTASGRRLVYDKGRAKGYVPYCGRRALDRLTIHSQDTEFGDWSAWP